MSKIVSEIRVNLKEKLVWGAANLLPLPIDFFDFSIFNFIMSAFKKG